MGTTSITIEWSELDCTDRNGIITGYRVRYGPTSTTPSQRQIATISNPGRRMFTVDREFITLSYDFEVAAVNVNGTGPYSTPPLTVDTAIPSGNILSLLFLLASIIRIIVCSRSWVLPQWNGLLQQQCCNYN